MGSLSSPLKALRLDRNDLFPNKLFCFIALIVDVEKAPRKKKPIIIHRILSKAIEDEKAWPDWIISVSGSKGSKYLLI